MKCKTSNWGCPYHACMSNECQEKEVIKNGGDFGKGICEKYTINNFGGGRGSGKSAYLNTQSSKID